jgi:hypothetical protein
MRSVQTIEMTKLSRPVIRPGITCDEIENRLFETALGTRARDSIEY